MSKGSYPGGGTIVGPKDVTWFGHSGVAGGTRDDATQIAQRQANPLSADAQRRIDNLRVDIAGLKGNLVRLDDQRAKAADQLRQSQGDLAALLGRHGLPLDAELAALSRAPSGNAPLTKTTRHQRRKKAKAKQTNG
ncbi:MAG: hypothetical protein K2W78_11250 [Xanthobacteraceae bacterium]|nr:hypothetical protein [Xanthobacteraceae bacterium]